MSAFAPMASDPNVNTMYYGHANVGNMVNSGVEIISRNPSFRRLTLTTTLNLYNSHLKFGVQTIRCTTASMLYMVTNRTVFVGCAYCMASACLPWNMTFQATGRYNSRRITAQDAGTRLGWPKPGYAKISVLGISLPLQGYFQLKRDEQCPLWERLHAVNPQMVEVAHYVWPLPIPSEIRQS